MLKETRKKYLYDKVLSDTEYLHSDLLSSQQAREYN